MPIGELELTDRIDPKAEKVLCDGCIANALAKNAPPYHVSKLNDKEFVVKPDFPIGFTRTGFMKRKRSMKAIRHGGGWDVKRSLVEERKRKSTLCVIPDERRMQGMRRDDRGSSRPIGLVRWLRKGNAWLTARPSGSPLSRG